MPRNSNRDNEAIEQVIEEIVAARKAGPNGFDRIVFCFPRVRVSSDESTWMPPSIVIGSAVAIASRPEHAKVQPPPIKKYNSRHSIPSAVVTLSDVTDVEYHVSRANMKRLLRVGCAVVRNGGGRRFEVRIPYRSPMLTNQPWDLKELGVRDDKRSTIGLTDVGNLHAREPILSKLQEVCEGLPLNQEQQPLYNTDL